MLFTNNKLDDFNVATFLGFCLGLRPRSSAPYVAISYRTWEAKRDILEHRFTIPERILSCIASAGNTPTTTLDPIHRLFALHVVEEALSRRNPKLSSYTAEILLKRFNYTSVDYVVYKQQTRRRRG